MRGFRSCRSALADASPSFWRPAQCELRPTVRPRVFKVRCASSNRSLMAALPARIGGLHRMSSNQSARAARKPLPAQTAQLVNSFLLRLCAVTCAARGLMSTALTEHPGKTSGDKSSHGAPAATQIGDLAAVFGRRAGKPLPQQNASAFVHAFARENAAWRQKL